MSRVTTIINGEEYVQLTITVPKDVVQQLDEEANDKDFNDAEQLIEDKLCNC